MLCMKVESVELLVFQLAQQHDTCRLLDYDQINIRQHFSRSLDLQILVKLEIFECIAEDSLGGSLKRAFPRALVAVVLLRKMMSERL